MSQITLTAEKCRQNCFLFRIRISKNVGHTPENLRFSIGKRRMKVGEQLA